LDLHHSEVPWGTPDLDPSLEVRVFQESDLGERDELESCAVFHWNRNLSLQNHNHGKPWLHCCGRTSLFSPEQRSTGPRTHTTRSEGTRAALQVLCSSPIGSRLEKSVLPFELLHVINTRKHITPTSPWPGHLRAPLQTCSCTCLLVPFQPSSSRPQ